MPVVNERLREIGGKDRVYHSECCKQSKTIESDEYAIVQTLDGKGRLRGTDTLRMERLVPEELSTRPNELRLARKGTTGFGNPDSQNEPEGFKAKFIGWRPPTTSPSTTRSIRPDVPAASQAQI